MARNKDKQTFIETGNELCKSIEDLQESARRLGIGFKKEREVQDDSRQQRHVYRSELCKQPAATRNCRTCATIDCLFNQEDSDDD